MGKFDSGKRVMSGTWGEVWLDNEYVAEAYSLSARITYAKSPIARCGLMANDHKVTGYSGSGTIGMHKISSRMAVLIGKKIRNGEDVRFTVISKLDDPDAYGQERVRLSGVSFDDLTLANWEANTSGRVDVPFTFTDYDFLDTVEV